MVIGGRISLTANPNPSDFYVAGLFQTGDTDSWIAYWQNQTGDDIFGTYKADPADNPSSNGTTDAFSPDSANEVKADGNFDGMSGGLGDEFGQAWDSKTKEWDVWMYNYNSTDDWTANDYDAWVGQFDSKSSTYFVFTDSFTISGANSLNAALAAAAMAIKALFL